MDNVSGNANWTVQDVQEKKKKKEEAPKAKKQPNLKLPDFSPLETLLNDTREYYEKKPTKAIGDIITDMETLQRSIKNLSL